MDISEEIYQIVSSGVDTEFSLRNDKRWQIRFNSSLERRNLLEWYPFETNSNLLEIGAKYGSLTGLFCEKLRSVTSVEVSKLNGQIIEQRNKKYTNLKVVVGKLDDIKSREKFDYITMIGTLETAENYNDDKNPTKELLSEVQKLLKPSGTLILAFDNKYGLKCGGTIPVALGKRKSFTKREISNLLLNYGFRNFQYYYPYPDYNMPLHIFSDDYLPSVGQLNKLTNYEKGEIKLWNEKLVFNDIITDGNFGYFSNSFLVIAKRGEFG